MILTFSGLKVRQTARVALLQGVWEIGAGKTAIRSLFAGGRFLGRD